MSPVQLLTVVERLWPDASHAEGSTLAVLLRTGTDAHSGPWLVGCRDDAASGLPCTFARSLHCEPC